jgi:hypothetical protein
LCTERWLRYDGTDTGATGKVVLAKTDVRHQVSDLSGGRPTMVMVLMEMVQDSGER